MKNPQDDDLVVCAGNVLDLCAGIGGFSLGLSKCGGRTVCYVERDTFAAAVLVARMAEEALDKAPIWDCIETFDGHQWCGVVDTITAGFPCQPFSPAGLRQGTEDERWLWPEIARVIEEVEPSYVFLENVPNIITRGGVPILSDLARLGYDAIWDMFYACSVGAPQIRKRFFLLAYPADEGFEWPTCGEKLERFTDTNLSLADFPPWLNDLSAWKSTPPEDLPAVCREANGLPSWMDNDYNDRIRSLANAVVPDLVAYVWRALWARVRRNI